MKESDHTPYIDNRATLYQKTLRSQIEMEGIVSGLLFGEQLQMPVFDQYSYPIGSVPINDQFLEGHKKIVKSLEQDLVSQGEVGQQLRDEIMMEISKEYRLNQDE